MAKVSGKVQSTISDEAAQTQFVHKWVTLINRLDYLFGFTGMTETDPEMFVT